MDGVTVDTTELRRMRRQLRKIGRDLAGEVKAVDRKIADDVRDDARTRARRGTRVQRFAAPAIRSSATAGKGAVVSLGGRWGRTKPGRRNAVAFGAEFGSKRYPQFPRFKKTGYFYFPAIETARRQALDDYADMIADLYRRNT